MTWPPDGLLPGPVGGHGDVAADASFSVTGTMEFPLTVAPVLNNDRIRFTKKSGGWQLTGTARRIPWARHVSYIVVVGHSEQGPVVALVNPKSCVIEPGQNLAGEPRDNVDFTGVRLDPAAVQSVEAVNEASLLTHGALARAVMMAGALERILELSVTYANERTQFGRPIGRFQAIQQQLAVLAGETIAAGTAADSAVEAFTSGGLYLQTVMMAKIRVNQAVSTGVPIAHQVHGAIGFTDEHDLHLSTRRLWAWREEFGTESEWADRLGEKILQIGAKALWPTVTSSP